MIVRGYSRMSLAGTAPRQPDLAECGGVPAIDSAPAPRPATPAASAEERGVVLVMALLLLTVLTVIATSAMNTATRQLAMARTLTAHDQAFQAAETGIDLALALGNHSVASPGAIAPMSLNDGAATTEAAIAYLEATPVPDAAFSLGGGPSGLTAFHFEITAVGTGPGNSRAVLTQGFYVLGPGSAGAP